MFFIDCSGQVESDTRNKIKFVVNESKYWKCSNIPSTSILDITHSFENVSLFNNEYNRGSTLRYHVNDLFCFARKYFQFLNKAARNNYGTIATPLPDYGDYGFLRRSISDFFIHIRNFLDDLRSIVSKNGQIKVKDILLEIKQAIFHFRLIFKSIDCLPDYVIRNSTSEIGNQCVLASFHLFHCHLELHWLNLILSLNISTMEQMLKQETLVDSENPNIFSDFQATPVISTAHNPDVEKEMEWILYNLILLCSKCYDKLSDKSPQELFSYLVNLRNLLKMPQCFQSSETTQSDIGPKHVFSCNCVKQIWIATQMLIEHLHLENKSEDFWFYYNQIFRKYILQTDKIDKAIKNCNMLYVMNKIDCVNKLEFSLWLLLNIVQSQGYNYEGTYIGITSHRIQPNYILLEEILKQLMNGELNIPESTFRDQMRHVIKLLTVWWEPKNEIITLLWEYFHKRMNSAFSVAIREDNTISLLSSTAPDVVTDLKSRLSMDNSSKRDNKCETSFSLFVSLLGIHLKKSVLSNQQSNCQRIKGRILPKFTISKILALNELGLQHFATMFLMMGVATDLKDICSKLQDLIVQLPFDTLPWIKKQVIIKIHICILYLYVDNSLDVAKAAKPLLAIANKYCTMRDSESMNLMKIIVSGISDTLSISSNLENNEYIFIDSWMAKYLSICSLPDLTSALESLSSLLSKLTILCAYQDVSSESITGMIDNVFQHMLVGLKSLYSNGIMALQIADTAFNFTKFVFDSNNLVKKYDSFEDMLQFFTVNDIANERITRHYLLQILQDDRILQSFEDDKKHCTGCLIHCWIKCTLLSTEGPTDDDTHLMLLMCQLSEFSSLNITPSCGSGDQRNLCKFFHSIGIAWNHSQSFQEKCQLRERVNKYLSSMDKYVLSVLKAPSSLEYVMQIFLVLGTMFLHCSPIIYSRAKPTCLLHTMVSNILLPPQLFMEKKVHPHITSSICKSWYLFMRGLYQLDYKNDMYIEKTMKDMIIQYLPYFANKTIITKNNTYDISFRMIPNETSTNLQLEKYILDKISLNFITCRGKQCHIHASKALGVIHHLVSNTTNIHLIRLVISCILTSVCEQFMFSDAISPNKKIAAQLLEFILSSQHFKSKGNDQNNIQNDLKEVIFGTCHKHLAFNSAPFFKLLQFLLHLLTPIMDEVLSYLDTEISKVERMRGVGYDHGLRNGLNEISAGYSKIKTTFSFTNS